VNQRCLPDVRDQYRGLRLRKPSLELPRQQQEERKEKAKSHRLRIVDVNLHLEATARTLYRLAVYIFLTKTPPQAKTETLLLSRQYPKKREQIHRPSPTLHNTSVAVSDDRLTERLHATDKVRLQHTSDTPNFNRWLSTRPILSFNPRDKVVPRLYVRVSFVWRSMIVLTLFNERRYTLTDNVQLS
jgi:hypothetical protein